MRYVTAHDLCGHTTQSEQTEGAELSVTGLSEHNQAFDLENPKRRDVCQTAIRDVFQTLSRFEGKTNPGCINGVALPVSRPPRG